MLVDSRTPVFRAARFRPQQQGGQGRCGHVVQARPGDVLLVAEGISKTYDGEKQLFGEFVPSACVMCTGFLHRCACKTQ